MHSYRISATEKDFQGASLIIAPILLAASSFFWIHGEYSVTSATLIILPMFFWIPALTGLFALLKEQMPRYAVYGLWVAVFGCISGTCFAFLGYLTTVMNIPHEMYLKELSNYPVTSQLLLFATGPLFPLSIMLLGINLTRATNHVWVGLMLFLGGIAFPASRIPRLEWMAHIADLLLLVPCVVMGFKFIISQEKSLAAI